MKASHNTAKLLVTASNNLFPYIEFCNKHNIPWRTIASGCGIQPHLLVEEQWLATNDVLKFLHRVEQLHGKKIGIEVGQLATIALLSPNIEKLVESVSSLDEAIHILVSEINKLSNHVTIWTEFRDGRWWLCHRSCYHPSNLGFEQAEWFRTCALVNYCQRYLGDTWQPEITQLISSLAQYDDLSKQYPNSTIMFESEYGALSIPMPDDYRPLTINQAQPDWFESVLKLIETYAFLPWFNIEWFGDMLGMSKRTLQRNLKTRGLIFKDLKESARFEKAKQLLIETPLSVQEVSWQLGYTDLSNFNRAFRRWAGMTASKYRKIKLKHDIPNSDNSEFLKV